jgi:hypothetical protein
MRQFRNSRRVFETVRLAETFGTRKSKKLDLVKNQTWKKQKPDERTIKKQLSLAQNQAIGLAAGCGAARTPVS